MSGSEDTPTSTGNRAASKLYRRPPGAAWLLALVAIPLLLALIGWAGLNKSDNDTNLSTPRVNPSATLASPDVNAPKVNAPNLSLSPLSIQRTGKGFSLSGDLPSLEAKNSLMDSLKLAFGPDIDFIDNLNIKADANAPDFAALGSILGSAVEIPDFHFDLNGDAITLEGTAPTDKAKADVEAAAKAAWPNMKITNKIEVKAAPAPQAPPAPAPSPTPAPGGGP